MTVQPTKPGPLYIHVEQDYYRIIQEGKKLSLISLFWNKYEVGEFGVGEFEWPPRQSLTLKKRQVWDLDLKGYLLVLICQNGEWYIRYRTRWPGRARQELLDLFNFKKRGLGARITLERVRREYTEIYACVRKDDVGKILGVLPRCPVRADLKRPEYRTFYGNTIRLPIGPKAMLPLHIVVYLPFHTKTPGLAKIEIKTAFTKKKRPITKTARYRMVGLLSWILQQAGVTSLEKGASWVGKEWKDSAKRGIREKSLIERLSKAPKQRMDRDQLFEVVAKMKPGLTRGNFNITIANMERKGSIACTVYKHKSVVALLDYSGVFR